MAGRLEAWAPGDADAYLSFRYRVFRSWRQPVAAVLNGGLGTLPMAPISDVPPEGLPQVIRRIGERLELEAAPDEAGMLWTAT